MTGKRFPNEQLLVPTEWVADHLDDADLRVVEVTPPGTGYPFGHLPGAVYLDLGDIFTGRATGVLRSLGPADEVAAALGGLGISPEKRVVLYDEIGGQSAAQALWALEYLGFDRVAIMEGGIERWMAEGRPQAAAIPSVEPASFAPSLRPERLATAEWLVGRLGADDLSVLDCRTEEEYGEAHIPGARHRSWEKTLVLGAYQSFRDADDLRADFTAAGATEDKEVVTYCVTGMRSSHTYLALRLLGYPRVRNYDASWSEWGARTDLPKA